MVTLGECTVSFVARERGPLTETADFRSTVAGAEANVAVGLARLGVPVAYIGRVGADGLGTTILRRLRGEGVDVRHLRIDEAATTGVMIRELRVASRFCCNSADGSGSSALIGYATRWAVRGTARAATMAAMT